MKKKILYITSFVFILLAAASTWSYYCLLYTSRKRFLFSDVTPEGLIYIHAQNKRGLCLWTDELSAWFKNFNRYNNGSEEQF